MGEHDNGGWRNDEPKRLRMRHARRVFEDLPSGLVLSTEVIDCLANRVEAELDGAVYEERQACSAIALGFLSDQQQTSGRSFGKSAAMCAVEQIVREIMARGGRRG